MRAYRDLFGDAIDQQTIHEIRGALNQELVFGRSNFKDKIEAITQRQTRIGQPGRPLVKEENAEYYIVI